MKIKQIYNVMFHKFLKEKKDCKYNIRKWNINLLEKQGKKQSTWEKYKIRKNLDRGVLYNQNFVIKKEKKIFLKFIYNVMNENINLIKNEMKFNFIYNVMFHKFVKEKKDCK